MRLLFGAHAVSLAFGGVVEAALLRDFSAGLDNLDVPLDLVLEGFADKAERVNVLDFGLGAEFFLAFGFDADISVTAKRTFFHVAIAYAGVEDDFLEASEIFVGFVGRSEVRLA